MHTQTDKKGKNGLMAEWLGRGLQNLVQRFESASDLTASLRRGAFFIAYSPDGYLLVYFRTICDDCGTSSMTTHIVRRSNPLSLTYLFVYISKQKKE